MAFKRSNLHMFLECFLSTRSHKVSFLQIGANDGVNADFVRSRALKNNWYGVLVEPHPNYFDLLKSNYSSANRVHFENIAISSEFSTNELYYVKDSSVKGDWSLGIASFDRNHIVRHGVEDDNISSVHVESVPLSFLVEKYYLYDVDLMVVDVEGHEVDVFKSVDFSLFHPKLIVFEHHHLSDTEIQLILEFVGDNYDYVKAEYDSFLFRVRND